MQSLIKTWVLIIAAGAVTVFVVPGSHAEIILDTAFPIEKQVTRIHVASPDGNPIQDAVITTTYRPGSAVPAEFEVGRTDNSGNCDWTPTEAGIVTISAAWLDDDGGEQTATINSSVKYNPTPIAGIVIMIIAGVVLIGGSIERIARLLGSPEPE